MALAGRNVVPLPPSLPQKSGNVNWKSKVTVGVYNVSGENGENGGREGWTAPGRATSRGEIGKEESVGWVWGLGEP